MTATITGPVAAKVRTATRDAVALLQETPRMGRRCAASKAAEDSTQIPLADGGRDPSNWDRQIRRESGAERSVEIPDAPIPGTDEGDVGSELVDIDVDNRAFAEFCVEVMRARELLANELALEEGDA